MASFIVYERVERTVIGVAHRIRVVHGERSTDPYAAVGTHMRFKATVRYQDAAEHTRGRIILGFHIERAGPHVIVAFRRGIHSCTRSSAATLTTADDHVARIREVPHNLLSTLGIGSFCIGTAQLRSLIIHIGPPEPPTIVEVHIPTGHINDHGRGVRNIREAKAHAGIRRGLVKHACRQIEHLHGGLAIAFEFNDLLVYVVNGERIRAIKFGAYQIGVVLVVVSCLSISHVDAI